MKSLLRNVAVVAIVLATHSTAHAQKSWNVTTGTWTGTSNWSPTGVPATTDTVVINNGGTATLNTNSGFFATLSIGSNSAIVQTANASYNLRASSTSVSPQITNAGLISVNAGVMNIFHNSTNYNMAITNTGGTIRTTGTGLLNLRDDNYSIAGGQIEIGAGSMLDQYKTMTLTNVAYSNSGTTQTKTVASEASSTFQLSGTSSFSNTGVLSINNGNNLTNGARFTKFVVDSTASLSNATTGVINILRSQTTTLNVSSHEAFLELNATGFNNQGAINITSYDGQVGTAQFRALSVDFSSAGAITVDGPRSAIQMAGRTFTQTAGSLSLINGGAMTAGSVLINSGTLLGTGTINAPVTIGGILSPGSSGIGTLSVSNGVTWNAGNAWKFELGNAAASLAEAASGSTGDLLALTGTFGQGTGSAFTFDFASTGTDGWYKLVDYASTTFTTGTNSAFKATNLPTGKTATFVVDPSTTALYVQIVPEPGTIALAGVGVACAGLMYRKRRRDR
jgi:hypothetical protein